MSCRVAQIPIIGKICCYSTTVVLFAILVLVIVVSLTNKLYCSARVWIETKKVYYVSILIFSLSHLPPPPLFSSFVSPLPPPHHTSKTTNLVRS